MLFFRKKHYYNWAQFTFLLYFSLTHEWLGQNFSFQYQLNSKQTSDENKEKYQWGDY